MMAPRMFDRTPDPRPLLTVSGIVPPSADDERPQSPYHVIAAPIGRADPFDDRGAVWRALSIVGRGTWSIAQRATGADPAPAGPAHRVAHAILVDTVAELRADPPTDHVADHVRAAVSDVAECHYVYPGDHDPYALALVADIGTMYVDRIADDRYGPGAPAGADTVAEVVTGAASTIVDAVADLVAELVTDAIYDGHANGTAWVLDVVDQVARSLSIYGCASDDDWRTAELATAVVWSDQVDTARTIRDNYAAALELDAAERCAYCNDGTWTVVASYLEERPITGRYACRHVAKHARARIVNGTPDAWASWVAVIGTPVAEVPS